MRGLFTHEDLFKQVNGGRSPHSVGERQWNKGCLNEDVNAEEYIKAYYQKYKRQSNIEFKFVPIKKLLFDNKATKGVVLDDDTTLTTDLVILAAGPWSNTLLDLRDLWPRSCMAEDIPRNRKKISRRPTLPPVSTSSSVKWRN